MVSIVAIVRIHRYAVEPADVPQLMARRVELISTIRASYPGLAEVRLTRLADGTFTDTWRWDSAEQMRAALAAAPSLTEVGAAMSLTKGATAEDGEIVDER